MSAVGVLDRKVLRDLWRLKTQVLAIALVMAAGVATLVLGVGTYQSLVETQGAYYERQRFADVFAQLVRAPERLRDEIAAIPGMAVVETRIVEAAILDIEGMAEPGAARLVSLPDTGEAVLNTLSLRLGRMPDPAHPDEVVVNEAFADAHGFAPGARFSAIVNGRQRQLEIVGVGLSPEFLYLMTPGALMPDDRRNAVVWMSRRALAAAFDLSGAFSEVSARLLPGTVEAEVIERMDEVLEPFGGQGGHGRADQSSHAILDAELQQLRAMAPLPPVFLFVAAFLVNMTLGRLVALEREQIGLMKALGRGAVEVAWHYLKFVLAIAAIGAAIGVGAGTLLGRAMAELYASVFHFPFLVFRIDAGTYVLAIAATALATTIGAGRAVWSVAALSPAVAMQPAPPPRYRKMISSHALRLSQTTTMIVRNIVRRPLRAGFTVLGMALSVAILVSALFFEDALEEMLDITYFQADRQDATLHFSNSLPISAMAEVGRLPGVLSVEPVRIVPVRLSSGHISRRVSIEGRMPGAELSRTLDRALVPVALPETGLLVSEMLAVPLGLRVGDLVSAEILEGRRRTVDIPVMGIVQGYMGMTSYMDIAAINRLMGEGARVSGAVVTLDPLEEEALYAAVKARPPVAAIGLQRVALELFYATLAENLLVATMSFAALALVIAFGVVYNSARIQLSERARELASLRALGFTRGEVSWILFSELAFLSLVAVPLGWLLGFGLALAMTQGFTTEIYSIPLVISRATYFWAGGVVLAAAAASALIVRRRIDRLDLVEVLKTRE